MKKKLLLAFLLLQGVTAVHKLKAQQLIYKDPILKIDFGSRSAPAYTDPGNLSQYREQGGSCPDDGNYTFASRTAGCFNNDWITMTEDHTPGDIDGNMMLVNAAVEPGTFFQYTVNGIKPNSMYEISVWLVNVCRTSSPCNPTPPNISFTILTPDGRQLKKIRTGILAPMDRPLWLRYYNEFNTPAGISSIIIKMDDETNGGCGNDFAMDDITLREVEIVPPPPPAPKPVAAKPATPKPVAVPVTVTAKPVAVKKEIVTPPPQLKKSTSTVTLDKVNSKPVTTSPVIKQPANKVLIPEALLTRSNPLIRQIETGAAEMLIRLYDNGEVDGDTVTVYDNNVLLVSHAGLSEKPVTIKIKVDKEQPHHELVMVADNLGSIPPNTSLMIVTAGDNRYEIFISSSKQENARIVIDLKE